jgi:hypothetical protein
VAGREELTGLEEGKGTVKVVVFVELDEHSLLLITHL